MARFSKREFSARSKTRRCQWRCSEPWLAVAHHKPRTEVHLFSHCKLKLASNSSINTRLWLARVRRAVTRRYSRLLLQAGMRVHRPAVLCSRLCLLLASLLDLRGVKASWGGDWGKSQESQLAFEDFHSRSRSNRRCASVEFLRSLQARQVQIALRAACADYSRCCCARMAEGQIVHVSLHVCGLSAQ